MNLSNTTNELTFDQKLEINTFNNMPISDTIITNKKIDDRMKEYEQEFDTKILSYQSMIIIVIKQKMWKNKYKKK
jgi:hypothetical protein